MKKIKREQLDTQKINLTKRKDKVKHQDRAEKEPMDEDNLMSVLELLELQARARAIRFFTNIVNIHICLIYMFCFRSQLELENRKKKQEQEKQEIFVQNKLESNNDDDEIIMEVPKEEEIVITSSDSDDENDDQSGINGMMMVVYAYNFS